MDKTICFIGSGNMGSAIISGILAAGLVKPQQIIAADLREKGLKALADAYGIRTVTDNCEAAKAADILFLCIKPNVYPAVIGQIKDSVPTQAVIVSIAAGQTIAQVEALFGRPIHLMRIMPNTPAMVGEGMSALCPNALLEQNEIEEIAALASSFGKAEVVPESLIDAVVGVSGSSPAYVYLFIEAMADAAVADGMPRAMAYKFAAQSVLGSAKMVLETGLHPGALKDMVCSPGGTTIEAVAVLEEEGLRNAVIKAQRACSAKSKAMSEK